MKKRMFELWYHEVGKEIAEKCLPIDDATDNELRIEAKRIFNSTYGIFSSFMEDRLMYMKDEIQDHLLGLEAEKEEWLEEKEKAEDMKNEITPYMTELYDCYFKERSIKKEQFERLKAHFGKILDYCGEVIGHCELNLSELKRERKLVESLLPQ